ncbi:hypothetical protein LTR53_009833, partial [Teratosphaeriaceae sp. CCFEE 6253]
ESGRAGCDGERAYSLVILPSEWKAMTISTDGQGDGMILATQDESLGKLRERRAMQQDLDGRQYFRTSLSEHLDAPEHRRWCMAGEVPCDICQSGHEDTIGPNGRQQKIETANNSFTGEMMVQRARQKDLAELADYQEDLKVVRSICLLCQAGGDRWDHKFSTCHRRHDVFNQRTVPRQRHEEKGRRWLRPYTACFCCLSPQSVCRRADPETSDERDTCEDKDVVFPLCYGIFKSAQGGQWLYDHFGRHFDSVAGYFDWLGEESVFGGGRAIQAVRVATAALAEFRTS